MDQTKKPRDEPQSPWPSGRCPRCRLLEIATIGHATTGVSSGELDYRINVAAVEALTPEQRKEAARLLDAIRERVVDGYPWQKKE